MGGSREIGSVTPQRLGGGWGLEDIVREEEGGRVWVWGNEAFGYGSA